jgi:hypothetical protein
MWYFLTLALMPKIVLQLEFFSKRTKIQKNYIKVTGKMSRNTFADHLPQACP